MPGTIIILCAMPIEAEAVAQAFGWVQTPSGREWRGAAAGWRVELHCTGIGTQMARTVDRLTLDETRDVVIAGYAGGLDPLLKIGDVLLPSTVLTPDAMPIRLRGSDAPLLTTRKPVLAMRDKQALHKTHGCAAIDMETYPATKALTQRGITPTVIRTISDVVGRSLPSQVAGWLNPDGSPRIGRVVRDTLCKPVLLGTVMRLHANSQTAGHALALATREHLKHLARRDPT